MTDIALFPIPGCVTFPGNDYPLHVFEPRYRAMVKHCIATAMPMGLCHTQKVVRPAKPHQSQEEALRSNQATYKPYTIFSAGQVELAETFDDGRLAVFVHLEQRYRLQKEIQTLPFSIYQCEPYLDAPQTDEQKYEAELTREKIHTRLKVLTHDIPEVQKHLNSHRWKHQNTEKFSFQLFSFLRMPPEVLQDILELRSPLERLHAVLSILNNETHHQSN